MDDILLDVHQEVAALANSVRAIALARNSTLNVLQLAYEIGNMTMPITLSEIEELAKKIQTTAIDEGAINDTFADAQAGLRKAEEVQQRSQEAL